MKEKKTHYEDFSYTERLVFIYTYKCNARCEHCASEAYPERNEKLSIEDSKHYLDISAEKGYKWICWTGGEPLLYYKEILELMKYSLSLGMVSGIETNGIWGSTPERAYKYLKEMKDAGLVDVAISADAYHDPYVPFQNVVNIYKTAKELDIGTIIFFIYTGDAEKDNKLLDQLKAHNMEYHDAPLSPLGFAKRLPVEMFSIVDLEMLGDCDELGPLIVPNGDVISCCNPDVPTASPLHIGNDINKYGDMLDAFASSCYPKLIHSYGFGYIYKQLKDKPVFAKYKDKKYRHYCEFCEDIFTDELVKKEIDNICRNLKFEE